MVAIAAVVVGAMLSVFLWVSAPVVVTVCALASASAAATARRWPLLMVACTATLWALWLVQSTLGSQVVMPQVAQVCGCVVSPVWLQGRRVRFSIRTRTVDHQWVSKNMLVSIYDGRHVPREGECFVWQLKLRPPRGLINHSGDDPERRAFVRGVDAYAVVDTKVAARAVGSRWQQRGLHWRLSLARRIRFLSGEQSSWPLFVALTVGERAALPVPLREAMRDTGTAHLMAISGLHVGLLASIGFGVGRFVAVPLLGALGIGRWSPMAPWAWALACATGYAALAGFALPTVRALVMLWVFGLAALARRQISAADGLGLALIVVVMLSPRALLSGGLWLSFGAVAALMSLRLQLRERAWLAQWVAFVGLLPAVAVFMGRVSWVSPLANAVSVPLYAGLVVPLTLLAAGISSVCPTLAMWLYGLLSQLVQHHLHWLSGAAAWPGAAISVPDWSLWHVTLASLAVAVMLLRVGGSRVRAVAITACLPLLFARAPVPAYGQFVVDVLDVGQAMSVVVRTRSRTLIYDAGAAWHGSDAAQRIILPHLRGLGVRQVDRIVISHADMDHRGGAPTLKAAFERAQVWSGEADRLTVAARSCAGAPSWRWDGVAFSFVHPTATHPWRGNNASCVLLIEGRHGRALLTGDIEALGELSALHNGRIPAVDLVVGQHHGSATSSTAAFVAATRPRRVIFPTGYANAWSFPRASVQQRWQRAGAQVHDTATDGGLRCVFDGAVDGPRVNAARRQRPAVWRRHLPP